MKNAWLWTAGLLGVVLMVYVVIVAISISIAFNVRSASPPERVSNMELFLVKDFETKCNYLVTPSGDITPRYSAEGRIICK